MRLLDKGKEPARYPAHPPLLEHRELTIIGTTMLLIPSQALDEDRYVLLLWFFEEAPATPTDQPALPSLFSDLLSPSTSQVTARTVPAASATARTPSPRPAHLSREAAVLLKSVPFPARSRYLAHRRMALLKGQY